MKPITHYAPAARALTPAQFAERHAGPFLVHSSRSGGPLRSTVGGRTIDSLVVEEEPAAERADEIITVFAASPYAPRGQALSVGADGGSGLRVAAASVSRTHAWLRPPAAGSSYWTIEDAGSVAGTWLEGEALSAGSPRAIASGARISLGTLDLVFYTAAEFQAYVRRRDAT